MASSLIDQISPRSTPPPSPPPLLGGPDLPISCLSGLFLDSLPDGMTVLSRLRQKAESALDFVSVYSADTQLRLFTRSNHAAHTKRTPGLRPPGPLAPWPPGVPARPRPTASPPVTTPPTQRDLVRCLKHNHSCRTVLTSCVFSFLVC